MKIKKITAKKLKLELIEPFTVAIGTISYTETVIVKLETESGLIGYGEGSGVEFVTGELADSIVQAINYLSPYIYDINVYEIAHIHKIMDSKLVGNGASKAAIDLAVYDVLSKAAQLPLYKYLGGAVNHIKADMTVGLDTPENMAKEAYRIKKNHFSHIKIKAGANVKDDIETIIKIREAVGNDIHLKVDANQGWCVTDAIKIIKVYESFGVDAVEQPVPAWDIEGLKYIRNRSSVKIMADESCFTAKDAIKLIKQEAVDMINIKLMKCGGIYPALAINTIAENANVRCMLGCMMESKIAIAAGCALAAATENIEIADLDSFRYYLPLENIQGDFVISHDNIILPDTFGIGLSLKDM